MKNTKNLFKINIATYFLILTFLITGLIKNIILIYLIVIIHELGHVCIIKILRYPILKVEIYPMGGITLIDKKINAPLKHEFLIAIAGIFFQLLLFLIMFFFLKLNFIRLNTFNLFNKYNKTIIFFNILPIIPLDGYQILKSILEIFLSFKLAFKISLIISIIIILIFINYNAFFSLNNYLIISFLIYKIYEEYKNFRFKHLKFLLERYLFNLPFSKIKYQKRGDLNMLKKDTFHYFLKDKLVVSEKELLTKMFKTKY